VERLLLPQKQPNEVIVEIRAAAVNPSDVKAAIGLMPLRRFSAHTRA
jgi:NADPH:quinone reductase-like Zn-dependent oxidoreductase